MVSSLIRESIDLSKSIEEKICGVLDLYLLREMGGEPAESGGEERRVLRVAQGEALKLGNGVGNLFLVKGISRTTR